MNPAILSSFFRITLFVGAILVYLYPQPTEATEIKARYTSAQGATVTLQLAIGSPPPKTIIVIQNIPPGSEIIRSIPPHRSYKKEHGEIKWLIKKPATGNLIIQLHLKKPVQAGSISAMIRYLDANNGTLRTELVK